MQYYIVMMLRLNVLWNYSKKSNHYKSDVEIIVAYLPKPETDLSDLQILSTNRFAGTIFCDYYVYVERFSVRHAEVNEVYLHIEIFLH